MAVKVALSSCAYNVVLPMLHTITIAINASSDLTFLLRKVPMARASLRQAKVMIQAKAEVNAPLVAPLCFYHITIVPSVALLQLLRHRSQSFMVTPPTLLLLIPMVLC